MIRAIISVFVRPRTSSLKVVDQNRFRANSSSSLHAAGVGCQTLKAVARLEEQSS